MSQSSPIFDLSSPLPHDALRFLARNLCPVVRQHIHRRRRASLGPIKYAGHDQCTAPQQPMKLRGTRLPPSLRPRRHRPSIVSPTCQPGSIIAVRGTTSNANVESQKVDGAVDREGALSDGERRSYKFEIRRLQRELRAEIARADALQKQTALLLTKLNLQGGIEPLQGKVYIGEQALDFEESEGSNTTCSLGTFVS